MKAEAMPSLRGKSALEINLRQPDEMIGKRSEKEEAIFAGRVAEEYFWISDAKLMRNNGLA